jgi:hypothetical protein
MPRPRASVSSRVQEPPDSKLDTGGGISGFFQRGFTARPSVSAPVSFIDQIEEVLQRRIASLPAPLPYPVHVQTAEDGSLAIEVGTTVYGAPDEVPDPTIRKLIQDAVAQWEKG